MQPMDLAAARAVLGVEPTADWPEVRASYLRLVRTHHPDAAADLADSGRRTVLTAQITEAFAVLVAARTDESAAEPIERAGSATGAAGEALRTVAVGLDDTRTVLLDAAPMEAFLALHEVFSVLGAVSYIDRLSLVLEAIVTPIPGQATSLLAWLDVGPDGVTHATFGVESLGGHPPADLDALMEEIARLLASPRPPVVPT